MSDAPRLYAEHVQNIERLRLAQIALDEAQIRAAISERTVRTLLAASNSPKVAMVNLGGQTYRLETDMLGAVVFVITESEFGDFVATPFSADVTNHRPIALSTREQAEEAGGRG